MSSGPILTFDKSFLQSLNPDEAAMLDNFFMCNITPLFFVETLADLEKEVHKGRTPEQVVGNLAYKTPDQQCHMNPYHEGILASELLGGNAIAMDGRIFRAGGQVVTLNNRQGVIYKMSPEEEALSRWQHGEFLDLERQIAKNWRKSVSGIDYSETYEKFKSLYSGFRKPNNLKDAKWMADVLIDLIEQEQSLGLGMSILGIPAEAQEAIIQRWLHAGKPMIRKFTPYFRYVFSVDLFFYFAISADLISRVRPAGKADNKVDIAYLYYLPFCMAFVSSDNLHERVVPLFLREDQTFVKGQELKADLRKLDEHFSALPEDVRAKGLFACASYPPANTEFLVTRLWDKHLPVWREQKDEKKDLSPEAEKALVEMINKISKDATPVNSPGSVSSEDVQYVHVQRQILRSKGKWTRVPPDVQ